MEKNISIIGGDLRILNLIQMLKKDGFNIKTFGFEKTNKINQPEKAITLEECVQFSDMIISAIPFTKDKKQINAQYSETPIFINELFEKTKSKKIIAGAIPKEIIKIGNEVEIIDVLEKEELAILNAIPSAEGAIQVAMQETPITIHNSKILILGFGRIGKVLSNMLKGIGAKVYCEARKKEDLEWINAYRIYSDKFRKLK